MIRRKRAIRFFPLIMQLFKILEFLNILLNTYRIVLTPEIFRTAFSAGASSVVISFGFFSHSNRLFLL